MNKGISLLACIPLRKMASEKSEMISQLLFGEIYEILEQGKKFTCIKQLYDGYVGWISNETVTLYIESEKKIQHFVSTCLISQIKNKSNNSIFTVPGASSFYNVDFINRTFELNNSSYMFDEKTEFNKNQNIYDLAKIYIGSPYLWGGRTFMGIDCSGLVQNVFKMKNIVMPRDASQQAKIGNIIEDLKKSQKGDLAFFVNDVDEINHVGILDGNGNIIHSSGSVRIEILSNEGIINSITNDISHKLHSIRRIDDL